MRLAALLALSLAPSLAWGGDIVVWLEDAVPDEAATRKADNRTGGTDHLGPAVLAWPPQASSAADDEAYEALRLAIEDGKRRWEDFEVEIEIARQLEEVLGKIEVVRDARDRTELVSGLLFQGAAAHIAFEPEEFQSGDRAAPFRSDSATVGQVVNRPWMDAIALEPDRQFVRSDVADGASYPALKAAVEAIAQFPKGELVIPTLSEGEALRVDGDLVDGTVGALQLAPGPHYVVVQRGDLLAGRAKIEILAGERAEVPVLVDAEERAAARALVLQQTTEGLPPDVDIALQLLAKQHGGQVFLAALEGKKVVVLPVGAQTTLVEERVVTVLGVGELGGSVVVSKLFDQANGGNVTAPGASGSLGVEVGIYNFAVVGGLDLAFTAPYTITHGNADQTANISVATLAQPWAGLGGYVLRPTGATPSLLVAATYGWQHPAHMVFGGRATLGIPVDKQNTSVNNWLRFSVGGTAGRPLKGWPDQPIYTVFFRSGLAGLF